MSMRYFPARSLMRNDGIFREHTTWRSHSLGLRRSVARVSSALAPGRAFKSRRPVPRRPSETTPPSPSPRSDAQSLSSHYFVISMRFTLSMLLGLVPWVCVKAGSDPNQTKKNTIRPFGNMGSHGPMFF